jgi:hypothetical protein
MRDILFLLLALGLPAYFVLREGWRGLIGGTLLMWCIGYLALSVPRGGDPRNEETTATLWVIGGWLISLVLCGGIYGAGELARRIRGTPAP